MASDKGKPERSAAAKEASRRNGAKSRGPRTARGKAIAARNAIKHGLRVRQPVRPEDLPAWVRGIEANLTGAMHEIGLMRREELDRLAQLLVLIDRADRHISAELARLHAIVCDSQLTTGPASAVASIDTSMLRKLIAYRKRFRAERNKCIKHIISPSPKRKMKREQRSDCQGQLTSAP